MNNKVKVLTAFSVSIAIMALSPSVCSQETDQGNATTSNQKQGYCQFQEFQNHVFCNDGDVILFQPAQWGNDQLPLLAIYFLCNPDKPVEFNRAAVVCTYQKKTEDQFKDADKLASLAQQNLQSPGQSQDQP